MHRLFLLSTALISVALGPPVNRLMAQEVPAFELRLEGGAVWQSRNDVRIPNDESGTRFSLKNLVGSGPWPAARLYLIWNLNARHSLSALVAPLSVTETGVLDGPVLFAGEGFEPGAPVEGTYRFNSWRLGYRYRLTPRPNLELAVGITAKLRDAEIRLSQGETTARDTDLGFVPLLHLASDWEFREGAHLLFDVDGLAGGPGRAFDLSLQLGHDVGERWTLGGGYRMLEGGADVEAVYTFAWLHYGILSVTYRPAGAGGDS